MTVPIIGSKHCCVIFSLNQNGAFCMGYLGRLTVQLTSRPVRSVHLTKLNPQRLSCSCFTTVLGSSPIKWAKSDVLKSHPFAEARSKNSKRSLKWAAWVPWLYSTAFTDSVVRFSVCFLASCPFGRNPNSLSAKVLKLFKNSSIVRLLSSTRNSCRSSKSSSSEALI